MSYVCPDPTCRKTKCFQHCNNCGKEVFWRPPLLDKEIAYAGPKPLEKDGYNGYQVHRCMLKGTKQYKKITGDPIIDSIDYSQELYNFLKTSRWHYQTLK